ncbi:hypothetical protein GCM10023321_70360 [Pseudonocardia eucalypti]|uniref:RNA polymerase sigma-70 factor (ECF subfamily) n=1 Tax=Pseudonocardia eucalypti TaxID=648755 RepID=A0ABP9R506_9PSEU|nr:RNA polymerase sigma-70 factor (ECF subfamily) [Pseudonocardia eucalypti]
MTEKPVEPEADLDWDSWLAELLRGFDVRWLDAIRTASAADRSHRSGLIRVGHARGEAFGEWVARHYREQHGVLIHAAMRYLDNVEDAKEAVHDVIRRMLANPPALDGDDALRGYLYRAVRNEAISRLRQHARRREFEDIRTQLDSEIAVNIGAPLPAIDDSVTRQLVLAKALQRLSQRLREVLLLVDHDGHSMQSAADRLGITPGAVKRYLFNARHALREDESLRQLRSAA